MRVGVLGGTFDPVHRGHLALARAARDGLALDEVLFVPAGQPWRKAGRIVAPAADRLAMLRLPVGGGAGGWGGEAGGGRPPPAAGGRGGGAGAGGSRSARWCRRRWRRTSGSGDCTGARGGRQ